MLYLILYMMQNKTYIIIWNKSHYDKPTDGRILRKSMSEVS